MRIWLAVLTITLVGLIVVPQSAQADTVFIENQRDQKVILCVYRSESKELLRSRDCWSLEKNETVRWDRGDDRYRFDLRLFEQGLFELPICVRRDFSDVYRLIVAAKKTGYCVEGLVRTAVPPKNRETGEKVLANASGSDWWYPGIVAGAVENGYTVRLTNGRLETLEARFIADDVVAPGRMIEINWKNQGRWYPVRVLSRAGDVLEIQHSDGHRENTILAYVRTRLLGASN